MRIKAIAKEQEEKMNAYRKTARIVGALYITATVAGVLSVVFLEPILYASDYLINISANENQVIIGALFESIMAVAVAGIAFKMYPVLRKVNEALALWYVGARLVESIFFSISVISLLSLLTLSQEFVEAGAMDVPYFQTLGTLLLAARDWAGGALSNTVGFGPSILIFYYLLYRSKLVPRWLSGWGFIGAPFYIAAGFLIILGQDPQSTILVPLYLPIAVNEMVLAVWLIVRGFDSSSIAFGSAKTDINDK